MAAGPGRIARLGWVVMLMLLAWGGIAHVDAVVGHVQNVAEAAARQPTMAMNSRAPPRPAPPGRVFVLLVDSLRSETALSSPAIRELLPEGVLIHVHATQDAATVPSLRAAFTGESQTSLFVFLRNFVRGGRALPSIFTQLADSGGATAVFSDGVFYELALGIKLRTKNEVGGGDEETRQERAFAQALETYQTGEYQLVIFHLTTVDHVAHAFGIDSPVYRENFARVGELIRIADRTVPKTDTLVVMGDHGHDPAGRHFPGLEVPTVAVYRGPAFQPGVELGPVPLTIHRYLLSWGLNLPLSFAYRGAGAPRALAASADLPSTFAKPPAEVSSVSWRLTRVAWLLPLLFALALLGPPALAAARVRLWSGAGRRVMLTATIVAGAAAWGVFLANRRVHVPPLSPHGVVASWVVIGALACIAVASGRARRMAATWAALAVPALLLYPSTTRDGWATVMGPAWLVALALLAVDWCRRFFSAPPERRTPPSTSEWLGLVALPVAAALLLRFFHPEGASFVFGAWRGYLTSERMVYWITATTVARLVIFLRPSQGPIPNLVAVIVVIAESLLSFADAFATPMPKLVMTAVLALAAIIASVLRGAQAKAIARTLTTAALLVAYQATVAIEARSLLELEVMLAALRLTALAMGALGRPDERATSSGWLEGLAILIAAWSTLAFSLHRLEWHLLYVFFPPGYVVRHAPLFLPFIVGRYALPYVVARRLLAETRAPDQASSWPASFGLLAAKVISLVAVIAGYAIFDPTNELYFMAIQNVLALSPLSLALLVP